MKTQGRYHTAATLALVALMLAVPFACLLLKALMRLRAQESAASDWQAETPMRA